MTKYFRNTMTKVNWYLMKIPFTAESRSLYPTQIFGKEKSVIQSELSRAVYFFRGYGWMDGWKLVIFQIAIV